MHEEETTRDLGIADRLRRTRGRAGRRSVVSTKVTRSEHEQLEAVAKRHGKVLSEWAREVLLREARAGYTDRAIFTELLALRLLLNGALREVALARPMTELQYQALLAEVRKTKHQTAREVLAQYQPSTDGEK